MHTQSRNFSLIKKLSIAALITLFCNLAFADPQPASANMAAAANSDFNADTPSVSTPTKTIKSRKHKTPLPPAQSTVEENLPQPIDPVQANTDVLEVKHAKEKAVPPRFGISFYRPNYIIPYYYTFSPDNAVYAGNTPNGESLKHDEIKYQFSFKVPLWRNIFNLPSSLYFGYTQLSYWQAYNRNAFFRSTDYEPEIYLQNEFDKHMFGNWSFNTINLGLVHQSNGFGNSLERSWNRAYLVAAISNPNWMIAVKPWIIFHDSTFEAQNPNMGHYLGYGEIMIAWKHDQIEVSLVTRNFIGSAGRRSGDTLSASFPLTKYLNGYVQFFTGYGQSLIEYNHRTNSLGVGFSLSNWI
ncbi:MAG: phospholipase A [Pseudomonadota bacterium]